MRISYYFFLLMLLEVFPLAVDGQSLTKQASVTISGEVKTPVELKVEDINKMELTQVTKKDKNQVEHIYSGIELSQLLSTAGVALGKELRGEHLLKYLLIEASDGYQVLFSLAEADPEFVSRKIILAIKKDGSLLPSDEGPFHIIIDGEGRGSRNVRQVTSIKVKFAD
ncbi:molybdopterin-dependent oxidoreductase [Solitalea canadensis]|uniref:Sulfite oxidase-like oxidoreductase n=1 Tax=Solitalea canadensis (strain ATCC 29591 / DSM 3403 / JCM 21819 / LMG 8368 / NBRC 15130 / NCIMB 12057 / USAM 9D) TaxID=929556 RepID=H8KN80_SOLCM|nr:molybdopterin-dependent oxidoreductase [Solitalea canadensis]AFD09413.1 sulfite oxidase-like oxidoreductase [Solitalea canadensis DSM 3403]